MASRFKVDIAICLTFSYSRVFIRAEYFAARACSTQIPQSVPDLYYRAKISSGKQRHRFTMTTLLTITFVIGRPRARCEYHLAAAHGELAWCTADRIVCKRQRVVEESLEEDMPIRSTTSSRDYILNTLWIHRCISDCRKRKISGIKIESQDR